MKNKRPKKIINSTMKIEAFPKSISGGEIGAAKLAWQGEFTKFAAKADDVFINILSLKWIYPNV